MTHSIPAALIAAVVAIAPQAANAMPRPNGSNTNLSFAQKRQLLLTYRGADEICTSDSGNCMAWTNLALHCERQMSGERTDYSKPCTSAESFRERVTGIELSSAPGAYRF